MGDIDKLLNGAIIMHNNNVSPELRVLNQYIKNINSNINYSTILYSFLIEINNFQSVYKLINM